MGNPEVEDDGENKGKSAFEKGDSGKLNRQKSAKRLVQWDSFEKLKSRSGAVFRR